MNLLSPALLGDTIRVVSTSIAGGSRSATIGAEIWGSKGLVATGTHVKMVASKGAAASGLAPGETEA